MSHMGSVRFLDIRVEIAVSVRDVGTTDRVAPSAEALSRWENDGGAPGPRDELNEDRASFVLSGSDLTAKMI